LFKYCLASTGAWFSGLPVWNNGNTFTKVYDNNMFGIEQNQPVPNKIITNNVLVEAAGRTKEFILDEKTALTPKYIRLFDVNGELYFKRNDYSTIDQIVYDKINPLGKKNYLTEVNPLEDIKESFLKENNKAIKVDETLNEGLDEENISDEFPLPILESNTQLLITDNTVDNMKDEVDINPEDFTNHSGGALGSDTEWENIGKKYGVTNHNQYWMNNKTPTGNKEITKEDAIQGQQKVTIAARQMGRIEPTHQVRDERLIRNWSQVKYSDAIFAITTLQKVNDEMNYGKKAKIVQGKGGTGYAIQMGINENKPVYVFDQLRDQWYKNINGEWSNSEIPVLTQNFAGIGTRELNNLGIKAIEDVYKKTFNKENNNESKTFEDDPNPCK